VALPVRTGRRAWQIGRGPLGRSDLQDGGRFQTGGRAPLTFYPDIELGGNERILLFVLIRYNTQSLPTSTKEPYPKTYGELGMVPTQGETIGTYERVGSYDIEIKGEELEEILGGAVEEHTLTIL
jgi:hypothetical protein